MEYLVKFTQD